MCPENMTKCSRCKLKYSDSLFIPMHSTKKSLDNLVVCPICALELRNAEMGLPKDTPFSGEQANIMYEDALEERRENEKIKNDELE